MDDLVRPIAIGPVDRGPQSGVPRDQAIPRLLEGRRVELAAKTADELLDVMSRLGVGQRVEEHAFLHRREGIQVLDPAAVREARAPPPRDRALRASARTVRSRMPNSRSSLDDPTFDTAAASQPAMRRVPEQVRRVQGQARLPCSRHHPDAEDRVDADLEEVVVDADAAPAQQLGRDPGQDLLRGRARGAYSLPTRHPVQSRREAGSADRSSLPLGESGNASRKTYDDGTIGSGMWSCSQRLRSDAVGQRKRAGHRVGGEPLLAAGISQNRRRPLPR